MAIPRILLHIGTEKTGTTTIQQYLSKNHASLLNRYRVLYPIDGPIFSNNGHFPVAASLLAPKQCDFLAGAKHIGMDEAFGVLRQRIDAVRPRLTILSCEHFSSRLRADAVERLAAALAEYEVQALVYLRPQEEMVVSSFSTALTRGRRSWLDVKKIHPEDFYWNFAKMLETWSRAFSENAIVARCFQRSSLIGGDLITDFLAATGIPRDPDCFVPQKANPSLSAMEARFLHAVNQSLVDWNEAVKTGNIAAYERGQKLRNLLLEVIKTSRCFSASPPLETILAKSEKEALAKAFKPSNTLVAKRYFGRSELFKNTQVADKPESESQPISSELTNAHWVRIVLTCAQRIAQLRSARDGARLP